MTLAYGKLLQAPGDGRASGAGVGTSAVFCGDEVVDPIENLDSNLLACDLRLNAADMACIGHLEPNGS